MTLTNEQRFHPQKGNHVWYAPVTIGAPVFYHCADQSEFKKSKAEREVLKAVKKEHPKTRGYKFKTIARS